MSKNNSEIEKIFFSKWNNYPETIENFASIAKNIINSIIPNSIHNDIAFIADSEDIESYGKTAINTLEEKFGTDKVKLICNWVITHTEHQTQFSAIQKTYVEDFSKDSPTLIFFSRAIESEDFSSLIMQITRYATQATNPEIFICTPIEDTEFNKKVKREFPQDLANKMQFVHCIEQSESTEYNYSLYNYIYAYREYINGHFLEETVPDIVKERRNKRFKT